jgi:flagellar secretion chaperone FliS
MAIGNGRARYLADTVGTASPARLLVMLYDRLALDIVQGRDALRAQQYLEANTLLRHAQEIVLELRASLETDSWDGGPRLASIYGWLLKQLVLANVNKDAELAEHCRELVEPLRESWHAAAAKLMAEAS